MAKNPEYDTNQRGTDQSSSVRAGVQSDSLPARLEGVVREELVEVSAHAVVDVQRHAVGRERLELLCAVVRCCSPLVRHRWRSETAISARLLPPSSHNHEQQAIKAGRQREGDDNSEAASTSRWARTHVARAVAPRLPARSEAELGVFPPAALPSLVSDGDAAVAHEEPAASCRAENQSRQRLGGRSAHGQWRRRWWRRGTETPQHAPRVVAEGAGDGPAHGAAAAVEALPPRHRPFEEQSSLRAAEEMVPTGMIGDRRLLRAANRATTAGAWASGCVAPAGDGRAQRSATWAPRAAREARAWKARRPRARSSGGRTGGGTSRPRAAGSAASGRRTNDFREP